MSFVYDKTKIGKKIASGGDRKVYMYGSDRVIKISTLWLFVGRKLHDKLVRDYAVCKRYFPDFILETRDVTSEDDRGHVELQPYIEGAALRRFHVRDKRVRDQLARIRDGIDQMMCDGYAPIDLVGHSGMLNGSLSNILVDSSGRLHIIDTTLLEGRLARPLGFLIEPHIVFVRFWQRHLLDKFINRM